MSKKIVAHLTGGLGNQLFQLAAAISINADELEFETSLGKPRCNGDSVPDLFAFKLPLKYTLVEASSRLTGLSRKACGFALRSSVAPRRIEKLGVFSKSIEMGLSLILFLRTKTLYKITRGSGVGFYSLSVSNLSQYLVGYFQSYKYAEKNSPLLKKLEPVVIGQQLIELIDHSKKEKPLVVHFRLGDYLQESTFGIPGHQYYINALNESWKTRRYEAIWVFSDDIPSAKKMFPSEFVKYVRWISEVDGSPAATLQAMRYGHGYIIANSTFSWWGAYLSFIEHAPVIAPMPWFQGMDTPKDLIPAHWQSRDSDFYSRFR